MRLLRSSPPKAIVPIVTVVLGCDLGDIQVTLSLSSPPQQLDHKQDHRQQTQTTRPDEEVSTT
jgi:hypothetical protein